MKPDGDFVVGVTALVIVVLAIIGGVLYNSVHHRQSELKFSEQCQSAGKEVRYRSEGSYMISECKEVNNEEEK